MKELEEMKKAFDEFIAKAERTLVRMKGTAPKQILTKEEKQYLENFLRPFIKDFNYISKNEGLLKYTINLEHLKIMLKHDIIILPTFPKGTMYKGMELYKEYTLEELGLFEGE